MAGGDRKYGSKKRQPTHAGQQARTAANKRKRIERQLELAKRRYDELCAYAQNMRDRRERDKLRRLEALERRKKRSA